MKAGGGLLWLTFLHRLLCPPGAARGSAHRSGVGWQRGRRRRGLLPSSRHPSAVRPARPRHRSHSCSPGKAPQSHAPQKWTSSRHVYKQITCEHSSFVWGKTDPGVNLNQAHHKRIKVSADPWDLVSHLCSSALCLCRPVISQSQSYCQSCYLYKTYRGCRCQTLSLTSTVWRKDKTRSIKHCDIWN